MVIAGRPQADLDGSKTQVGSEEEITLISFRPIPNDSGFWFTFTLRPAFFANRLTLDDVFLFSTRIACRQKLLPLIINEGFGALNFQMWRGLRHGANIAQVTEK